MTTYYPDPSQNWGDIAGFGLQPGDVVDGEGKEWAVGYQLADAGSAGLPITWRNITFTAWAPLVSFGNAFAFRVQAAGFIEFENIIVNPVSIVGGGINDLAGISLRGANDVGIRGSSFTGIDHDTGSAMGVYLGCSDGVGPLSDIIVNGCTFSGNKSNDIRLALEIAGNAAIGQDIEVSGNQGGTGATGSFFQVRSIGVEAFTRRCQRISLLDNTLTASGDFALSLDGVDDGVVAGNLCTDCGVPGSALNNVIQISGCGNPVIENNTIAGVPGTGTGDGHCIIIDHSGGDATQPTTGAIVRNNQLSGADKAGSTAAGVALWQSVGALVHGNHVDGCNYGLMLRDNPNIAAQVFNNAHTGCLVGGMRLIQSVTTSGVFTVQNNVFEGVGPVAVNDDPGLGAWVEDYNEYFGFDAAGIPLGANSTFGVDPDLNPSTAYAQILSPGYDSGLYVVGFHDVELDQNGFTFKNPPDIGLQSNLISPVTAPIIAQLELLPVGLQQQQVLDVSGVEEAEILAVVDLTQDQTLETPVVTQFAVLTPIVNFQLQELGEPTLVQLGTIAIEDLAQNQTLESVGVQEAQQTNVDALTQDQTLETPFIFEDTDLGVIEGLTQDQALDAVVVLEIGQMAPLDMVQAQSLELVTLSEAQTTDVDDMTQAQHLGLVAVSDATLPRLTPPSRRIKVAGGLRKIGIGA